MSIGPDLFNSVEPPLISVVIDPPLPGATDDMRALTLRIKPHLGKSVFVATMIPRYCLEYSVFIALGELFQELASAITLPPLPELQDMLRLSLSRHLMPF